MTLVHQPPGEDPIQIAFEAYHRDHPEVYSAILRFGREVIAAGYARYSINAIFERIRWHYQIEKQAGDWKLNNNYRSRYARLVMEREPDFEGFFETRQLKSVPEPQAWWGA